MKISFILVFLILFFSEHAKSQDTAFISSKIKSFQWKVQREVERNIDILFPDSGYLERFLIFKVDSSGMKISKFFFTDEKGKTDTTINQKNISRVVIYWKDIFPKEFKFNEYTFIQPVLIRKREKTVYEIKAVPTFNFDKEDKAVHYFISFKQITIATTKYR